jgi:hypothetical protein
MKDIMTQSAMQEENNKTSKKCLASGRYGIPTVRHFR